MPVNFNLQNIQHISLIFFLANNKQCNSAFHCSSLFQLIQCFALLVQLLHCKNKFNTFLLPFIKLFCVYFLGFFNSLNIGCCFLYIPLLPLPPLPLHWNTHPAVASLPQQLPVICLHTCMPNSFLLQPASTSTSTRIR